MNNEWLGEESVASYYREKTAQILGRGSLSLGTDLEIMAQREQHSMSETGRPATQFQTADLLTTLRGSSFANGGKEPITHCLMTV